MVTAVSGGDHDAAAFGAAFGRQQRHQCIDEFRRRPGVAVGIRLEGAGTQGGPHGARLESADPWPMLAKLGLQHAHQGGLCRLRQPVPAPEGSATACRIVQRTPHV